MYAQYITRNMLNYLTFVVGDAAQTVAEYIIRFLYCGGTVKEYPVSAPVCLCKVTLPFWVGCRELANADTVQLLNAETEAIISQTPVIVNQS